MLQITIFLLALVLIYTVKAIVIARSSRELAADASAITLIHAEDHFEEALEAQKRDTQRMRKVSKTHYPTHGMRRQIA